MDAHAWCCLLSPDEQSDGSCNRLPQMLVPRLLQDWPEQASRVNVINTLCSFPTIVELPTTQSLLIE